jgi:hypothetical protein
MAKIDLSPVVGGVAVRTLPREMVHWFEVAVAARTISKTGVIKFGLRPICRIVAGGTLARVMIDRRFVCVTFLAIGKAGVVKRNSTPGF